MNPELIFATNNPNKVAEMQSIVPSNFRITSLKDAGINIDIPEPHQTLEENASEKSSVIYKLSGKNCFSEDTGLEVEALNGAPGVRSARYAGERSSSGENIKKLLAELGNNKNRSAKFRTVISLIINGEEQKFEGICKGTILANVRGEGGFGYDPVFVPEGAEKSFAEMTMDEKNAYSHRKKAIEKMLAYLRDIG